jgi:hypothetical protein
LGIEMIDYAEYALKIKKLEKEIHNLVLKRKYKEAELLATELVVEARQMRIWLIHTQEIINESNSNVRL